MIKISPNVYFCVLFDLKLFAKEFGKLYFCGVE